MSGVLSLLARWRADTTVRQTVRLLSAVGLAACVAWLINLQEPGWALITSVIVTQNSITDTISKGRDQLVGTLIGASVSIVPITLIAVLHWPLWLAFTLAFVPLAVLVSWKPEARMGVVTLMIAILFPTNNSPYLQPVERVLAILIGVGVSTLVTYVVLHEQARRDAFRCAAQTVRQIMDMLNKARAREVDWPRIQDMNDDCAASLRKVQAALEEARREHWRPLEERDPMLARLPQGLRQLQIDALVVARALLSLPPGAVAIDPHELATIRAGLQRGFTWIMERCESEAVARTGEDRNVAAGVISAMPSSSATGDPTIRFLVGILLADLKQLIALLGDDDTERPAETG
ncbi:FUSC family protein [Acetobacter sp.]|uniref:FUSC family protein n=1 Tax=Acetobacter sp. TaxID=440 RepID=UPI0039EB65B9